MRVWSAISCDYGLQRPVSPRSNGPYKSPILATQLLVWCSHGMVQYARSIASAVKQKQQEEIEYFIQAIQGFQFSFEVLTLLNLEKIY